ncbi:MAG: hypothetical protein RJA70_2921 [Pseudomonadota bacterium]
MSGRDTRKFFSCRKSQLPTLGVYAGGPAAPIEAMQQTLARFAALPLGSAEAVGCEGKLGEVIADDRLLGVI